MLGVKRTRAAKAGTPNKRRKEETPVKPVAKKEESSDDSEDETEYKIAGNVQLSEYEKMRMENIRRNQLMMDQLNLNQARLDLQEVVNPQKKKPVKGLKPIQKPKEVLPLRQSLRIRRLDPAGGALPDLPVIPIFHEPQHPRKPEGPLEMAPTNNVDEKDAKNFIQSLLDAGTKHTKKLGKVKLEISGDAESYEKTMQKLNIKEDHIAKVVPDRIFSIDLHPSETKTLVCAGDKWGKLGLWDVRSEGGNNGVYLFEPHSRPINCLKFSPVDTNKLYSASYDGTVRCMDVEQSVFQEVYATDDDDDILLSSIAFISSSSNILVGQSDGSVTVADSRITRMKKTTSYHLHNKFVRCVDTSPTNPSMFVTACTDGSIGLWDLRNIKNHTSSVAMVKRSRVVASAFFSPQTGNDILTTGADDFVTIYDGRTLAPKTLYRHDNHTGRWLTKFRAQWDPKTDNCFVVGSMRRPRQIDVYCTSKKTCALTHLIDESQSSVTSLNAFHPHRNVLAGGNSSGKVFLWTE